MGQALPSRPHSRNCNCDLQFVSLDSSIGILGRVQLEGVGSGGYRSWPRYQPDGDSTRYRPVRAAWRAGRPDIPSRRFLGRMFVPFDWGHFTFVYNSETMAQPPIMQELVDAPESLRIVIQDPRTATPASACCCG